MPVPVALPSRGAYTRAMIGTWEDDWEDPDYDDEIDGDDDENDVIACPSCGAEVYEDAVQCPGCGEYIERRSNHPFGGRSVWFIALGLLGILAVVIVLVAFGF